MDLVYFTPSFWTHKCLGSFISINSFPHPLPSHTTSTFHITNTILTITHGGGGEGWLLFLIPSMVRVSFIKPGLLTLPCVGFFSFLFWGLWNQINNKAKKETNNGWWWDLLDVSFCNQRKTTKSNKVCQQSGEVFVNKVWRNSWFCVLCCVCTLWKHPFRIIDIVPSFQEKTSVWGCNFGKAQFSRHN